MINTSGNVFSFQDIQTNVERSMQSLMSIGHRMLDMITRSPRLLLPASDPASQPPPSQPSHQAHTGSGEHFPDFKNCDCHFGKSHTTLDCNKSAQHQQSISRHESHLFARLRLGHPNPVPALSRDPGPHWAGHQ